MAVIRVECEAGVVVVVGGCLPDPGTIIWAHICVTQGLVEQINKARVYTLLSPCNTFSPKSRAPFRRCSRYLDNNMWRRMMMVWSSNHGIQSVIAIFVATHLWSHTSRLHGCIKYRLWTFGWMWRCAWHIWNPEPMKKLQNIQVQHAEIGHQSVCEVTLLLCCWR